MDLKSVLLCVQGVLHKCNLFWMSRMSRSPGDVTIELFRCISRGPKGE